MKIWRHVELPFSIVECSQGIHGERISVKIRCEQNVVFNVNDTLFGPAGELISQLHSPDAMDSLPAPPKGKNCVYSRNRSETLKCRQAEQCEKNTESASNSNRSQVKRKVLTSCNNLLLSLSRSLFLFSVFMYTDQGLRNIIDKLAEFVARNGSEFETITKAKQQNNPRFSFLFGGEFYQYYQWRVSTEQASKLDQPKKNTKKFHPPITLRRPCRSMSVLK